MATPEEAAAEAAEDEKEELDVVGDTLELSDEAFLEMDGPLEDPALKIDDTDTDTDKDPDENEEEDKLKEEAEAKAKEEADAKIDDEDKTDQELTPLEADDEDLKDPTIKVEDKLDPDLIDESEKDPEKKLDEENLDKDKKAAKPVKTEVDYKAEYEKMIAPFKANGHEMKVQSPDDVIRLKQMGANYHKKMAGLKPVLKIVKILEKNNLLEEGKLDFLIDLHNKSPEAITKLLKDSGMEPLDIDIKKESEYVPTRHIVADSEIDLDAVLDDIQSTPTYQKTLDVITNVWDSNSRNTIAQDPQIITRINEHMADGTYDTIMSEVTYQRSMGNLTGISDIQAYKAAGDNLFAAGKIGQEEPAGQKDVVTDPVIAPVKKDSEKEVKRKERKKAAAPTNNVGTPAIVSYNPLTMSDEEFEKIDPKDFQKQT
jgi:hypothetical protein